LILSPVLLAQREGHRGVVSPRAGAPSYTMISTGCGTLFSKIKVGGQGHLGATGRSR